ncbi:MAG: hypothetical protein LUF26_03775 [Firmicutes bacterium]|nr:hypothetical protein [Bacillota bacterium]
MKQRLQGLIAGIAIGAICAGGIAYAKSATETIEVTYDNIKVYKDNVLCELKDANGSTIEPFIYNGTTYMPVRGTANLADMEVTWDGAEKTVYLWDELVPEGTYLLDVCPPYETDAYSEYTGTDSFTMGGTKYTKGFTLGYSGGLGIPGWALFNLNSKYSTVEFTIGHVDGNTMDDCSVYFYLDGKLVKTIEVDAEALPQTVSLPVSYALQLKIETDTAVEIGFGNVTIH